MWPIAFARLRIESACRLLRTARTKSFVARVWIVVSTRVAVATAMEKNAMRPIAYPPAHRDRTRHLPAGEVPAPELDGPMLGTAPTQ